MLDPYAKFFSYMSGELADTGAADWNAPAGPDVAQLNDQLIAITESMFQTDLREAPISQMPGDGTDLAANGMAAVTPGLPDASGASAFATGIDRGDTKRADARQQLIFPPRGRHVASGHRNDPIFIYTDVNPGGTLIPNGPT